MPWALVIWVVWADGPMLLVLVTVGEDWFRAYRGRRVVPVTAGSTVRRVLRVAVAGPVLVRLACWRG